MSVITEGQRAGRGEPPPAEASERQKAVIWTMGGQLRVPHGPRRRGWGGGEAGQPTLLTDWLRLELGGCADLTQTFAVEGCQSHRVRRLRLQAHDGDDALHAGCCENMERITNDKKPTGEMVQPLWETLW